MCLQSALGNAIMGVVVTVWGVVVDVAGFWQRVTYLFLSQVTRDVVVSN